MIDMEAVNSDVAAIKHQIDPVHNGSSSPTAAILHGVHGIPRKYRYMEAFLPCHGLKGEKYLSAVRKWQKLG
jgi:hypothetical protein